MNTDTSSAPLPWAASATGERSVTVPNTFGDWPITQAVASSRVGQSQLTIDSMFQLHDFDALRFAQQLRHLA